LADLPVYWKEEISKFIEDVGGDPGDKEHGRKQQLIWRCPVPLHFHTHSPTAFVNEIQLAISITSHNHPRISFPFKVYHGYYYLVSSVGVSAPILKSSFTPKGKRSISAHVGLLYYLGSPELIPPPYKIAHPSSIPSRSFGGPCTYDGGLSLLPDPPHRSFPNRTHSFFSVHFFSQSSCGPPILWLATFVSIVVRLGSVLLPVARMPLSLLFIAPFCP